MLKRNMAILIMLFLGLASVCGCDDGDSDSKSSPATAELHYDGDPVPASGDGGIPGQTNEYLVYFNAAELQAYVGWEITQVRICYCESSFNPPTHDFTVNIYGKGTTTTPGTLLFNQAYTLTKGWNTITLSAPLVIGSDTEIWAGYATSIGSCWPASTDDNAYEDNKNWIRETAPTPGVYGEWTYHNLNIRIIVQE
ncbi:MAG TPA: hypothetical protein PK573_14660 [Spirochaetota bacterium]|nr:hypothetical protein [Spirochaetota bacterium]HRZ28458.1 hypothetical protein [Spirochaetota bacterium]HSA16136.1 hypothetical protein [Spirochaetota bacterium]